MQPADERRPRDDARVRREGPRVDLAREDRAERRDAGRDPELPEGVVDPRRHPRTLLPDGRDRGRRERRVDEADPDAADQEPGQQDRPARDGLTRLIDHIATAFSARPEPSRMRIGTRVDSRPAIGAATNETRLSGRNTQAGLERRQPEDVLQVERQVEEHREHRRGDRERRRLRSDERGPRKSVRSTIDVRSPDCDTTNSTRSTTAADEEADDPPGRPAVLVSFDQGEDQAEQATDQRHEPDRIEPAELGVARLAELPRREDDRRRCRSGC